MAVRRKGKFIVWRVTIPADLAVAFELQLVNSATGKPDYGARSQLITELLNSYMERLRAEAAQ